MDQEFNDTEEVEASQVYETTELDETQETVENFSDKLEEAETEEDVMALIKDAQGEIEPEAEPEAEPTTEELDTEVTENTDNMFSLKDGDIELNLNLSDGAERKQAIRLMQQGLNYAGKTTELAKHRSFVNYAEENGISLEDIQQLSKAKGGDKAAIANISKNASVDVFDLDNDMADDYKAEPIQLQQEADPQIDIIATEILGNDEHRDAFQKWFPTIPEGVQNQIMTDSRVLSGVQEDIAAGVFSPAMEQAYKYQRVNGMDFGSAYTKAKNEYIAINQPEPQTPPVSRGERQRASAPRSGGGASTRSSGYAPGAISDMNDEEFLANYNDILRSVQQSR